jgi:hypothetical protein
VQLDLQLVSLKHRAQIAKDETTRRVREQNVSLIEEQIEETKEALDMLHEMSLTQNTQKP